MNATDQLLRIRNFDEIEKIASSRILLRFVVHKCTPNEVMVAPTGIFHGIIARRGRHHESHYYPGVITSSISHPEGWSIGVRIDPDDERGENWFIAIALCDQNVDRFIREKLPLVVAYKGLGREGRELVKAKRRDGLLQ